MPLIKSDENQNINGYFKIWVILVCDITLCVRPLDFCNKTNSGVILAHVETSLHSALHNSTKKCPSQETMTIFNWYLVSVNNLSIINFVIISPFAVQL